MTEATDNSALSDDDILAAEVSDAMLERAGASPQNGGAFTVGPCTVMSDCGG